MDRFELSQDADNDLTEIFVYTHRTFGSDQAADYLDSLEPLAKLLGWEGCFSRGFTDSWHPWAFLGLFGFPASRFCGDEPYWGDFGQGSALPLPRGEANGRGKSRAEA